MDGLPYGQGSVTLQSGDLLLLYTDGITEAMAPRQGDRYRELFGTDRLDALLLDCAGLDAQQCVARVRADVAAFCAAAPPTDDQTLIAIRCL